MGARRIVIQNNKWLVLEELVDLTIDPARVADI